MNTMDAKYIAPGVSGLRGETTVPGDKSVSHRAVMLSALADTPVTIKNFLAGADCLSTVRCAETLGADIKFIDDTALVVEGNGLRGLTEPSQILDAGNSGTTLRLMMGMLAPRNMFAAFCGDASLSRRPMARVIKPLALMGAKIVGRQGNSLLPLAVLPSGSRLRGITYESPVASAQVKSAILLAALLAEGKTKVIEPYLSRNHTEKMLAAFGVDIEQHGAETTLTPPADEEFCAPTEIYVPGDISSAAYWLVAASVIKGSSVTLKDVGINETRTGILDVLNGMGANIDVTNKRISGGEPYADIVVRYGDLRGITFDASVVPRLIDEVPIIAAAALFAEGDTIMHDVGELKVKETDRLQAIVNEFNKIAVGSAENDGDTLIIHGKRPLRMASVETYADHRMAMTLAVVGAAGAGVNLDDAACVDISYPAFWQTFDILKS